MTPDRTKSIPHIDHSGNPNRSENSQVGDPIIAFVEEKPLRRILASAEHRFGIKRANEFMRLLKLTDL